MGLGSMAAVRMSNLTELRLMIQVYNDFEKKSIILSESERGTSGTDISDNRDEWVWVYEV